MHGLGLRISLLQVSSDYFPSLSVIYIRGEKCVIITTYLLRMPWISCWLSISLLQ